MYIDYSFAKVITILGLSKMKAEKMNRVTMFAIGKVTTER